MSDLTDLSILDAKVLLKKREISCVELLRSHLQKIQECSKYNAYTHVLEESSLRQAEISDQKYKRGEDSLIEGIPIAVKDLFCVEGVPADACSKILEGFVPTYNSYVTYSLSKNGGIIIGKTNMDEFAMGSANTYSVHGPAVNPHRADGEDVDLVPGGSSGGSAVAVAANTAMASLGSDTGGSIRQPASFVGIVGIKPTYGRCSRWGMMAFASSLDQAGVFAHNSKDAALVLEAISGHDVNDSTSADIVTPNFLEGIKGDVKGLRVGIPEEYRKHGAASDIIALWDKAIKDLENAGAEIINVNLPHTEYALGTYYVIASAEASSNLSRYDGVRYGKRVSHDGYSLDDMYEATRSEGFGPEVRRRIMMGAYVLSAGHYDEYYTKAQKVRTLISQDFKNAFEKIDVILTPTAPSCAFPINQDLQIAQMYENDVFTVPASLAGLPAISVPYGISSKGLPIGMHIIGNMFDEVSILNVAHAMEGMQS